MRAPAVVRSLAALALATGFASTAAAQGLFLESVGGYQDLTGAKDSAKAVFGSSGGVSFGGGLGYNLANGFFFSGWARRFSKDGERVFVAAPGSTIFPLGHPLSVKITPIQGTLGYRFGKSSLSPYVGVGGGVTSIKETSTVGGLSESTSESKGSYHALAGVDFGLGSISLGGEVMYLSVPKSIGLAGVSQVYGETNVGGFQAVAKLTFRFGK